MQPITLNEADALHLICCLIAMNALETRCYRWVCGAPAFVSPDFEERPY